jgi:LemA protein
MKALPMAAVGLLVVALAVGGCAYKGYNEAITLDENVKQQWAQVENQLQRRYDLIPNLVATVKGIAGQEQKVFLGIEEARTKFFNVKDSGTVAEKAEAANGVERALSRLLFLQETYPELKSNESFLKLQDELAGTENRLSVERKRYNESVETMNVFARRFPSNFYAMLAGVKNAEYFKPAEEAKGAPKVDFNTPEPAAKS